MSVETVTSTEVSISVNEPKKYQIILHNDDKTTFEFVIAVLQKIFHKSLEVATEITFHVHMSGAAVVGVYPKEIADEKVNETINFARANNYPLVATSEEV